MRPDALPDPRAHPALLAALAFAAGIVAASRFPARSPFVWIGAGAALLLVAALRGRRAPRLRPTLAALALTWAVLGSVATLGAARAATLALPERGDVDALATAEGARVTLVGRVLDVPTLRPGRLRFRLAVDSVATNGTSRAAAGRVQATLLPDDSTAALPALTRGDRVRFDTRLRPSQPRRNPADFDQAAYLLRHGIRATAAAYDARALVVTGSALGPFGRMVEAVRAYVLRTLAANVRDHEAEALLVGLVLGDRSGMDEATNRAFQNTGLLHLLAVSGLHVLLIGLVVYELLRGLLRRTRLSYGQVEVLRAVLTLALLVVYAVLTGGTASVVRAVVMAAVLIGGNVVQRHSSGMNALGVAALVVLAARPAQLFEPGFQLSFGAVAGLVLLRPVLDAFVTRRFGRGWKRSAWQRELVGGSLATLAATLATLPILLFHFGRIPLAGLALNLVGVPLTSATFAAALATVAFGPVSSIANTFGAASEALARLLLALARAGDRHLAAFAFTHYETRALVLLALAAALATLAAWAYPRLRGRMLLGTAALVVFALASTLWTGRRAHLDLVAFDVGQGDALLVVTPSGKTVLVDVGMRDVRFDAGERVVLPHLMRYGVDRVDVLVVTHPHADHAGGALALLRAGRVHTLVHNGDNYASSLWRETLAEARRQGVSVRALRAGDSLALDASVRLDVLSPIDTLAHPAETNDASLVLRLAYGRTTALLLGDAQIDAEAALVARYGPLLAADVVKVGHHGSRTSSAPPLVAASARPGCTALVSVAARNRHGLPDEEVLARWQRACRTVAVTSRTGAVWLRSNGERFERVDWQHD